VVEPWSSSAHALVDEIASVFGSDRIIRDPKAIARARFSPWGPTRLPPGRVYRFGAPAAILRPRHVDDISALLSRATAMEVPVSPLGAGTGVMGGAIPLADSLVLDMSAMNQILEVDVASRTARVQPGVLLGSLADVADDHSLLFAHDPWSRPIATIGGSIATNGVGYLAAGYGAMGDQVLGLEVVLPTGETINWPGVAKASTGPDLWRLFIGSEGSLGIITAAEIRLFPRPAHRSLAAIRFPDFVRGFAAIAAIGANGLLPSMVDYEEIDGPPLRTPADLHLAFDGPSEVANSALGLAARICQDHHGVDLGLREAEQFWSRRHASAERFARTTAAETQIRPTSSPSVASRYFDVALPIARVIDYCERVSQIAAEEGVDVHSFGIWARPELVSFIMEGSSHPDGGPLERAMDAALRLARREGGSMEYCHGVGLRLAHLLPGELGGGHDLLRRLKATVDPANILNRGKMGL
jgi:FAD/FMN-containing dehydrogenase